MPNRIIKESICSSEKLAALSDFEFRLWVGLITQADDAGRGDARPAIIKGHIFPFRERLSIKDIDAALQELAAKGCVALYKVDGKPYFLFPGWVKHQRVRDCKPKFPEPPENGALDTFAADCGELPQVAADCGYNSIQSESIPNTKEGVRAARFTPPTVGEVRDYCRERGNTVDAERFVDFYAAKGWMVGKNRMKDWKAAVRTWEKEDGDGKRRSQPRGVDREEAQRSDSKWGITYST